MPEIADLTATAALSRIRAGRLTPGDWRVACLERIAVREREMPTTILSTLTTGLTSTLKTASGTISY